MTKEELRALKERWTPELTAGANSALWSTPTSPFGTTERGQLDLRGLPLSPGRGEGLRLEELDLSASTADGLVLAKSEVSGCRFDFAEWRWSDYRTDYEACSFEGTKFSTRTASGGFGQSRFRFSSFRDANLSDMSSNRPKFEECSLMSIKMLRHETGGARFHRCEIGGSITHSTFSGTGGGFFDCDLREAEFTDCDFKMMKLERCLLGEHHLWFSDWGKAFDRLDQLAPKARDLAVLIDVWRSQVEWHPTQLLDLRDAHLQSPEVQKSLRATQDPRQ